MTRPHMLRIYNQTHLMIKDKSSAVHSVDKKNKIEHCLLYKNNQRLVVRFLHINQAFSLFRNCRK